MYRNWIVYYVGYNGTTDFCKIVIQSDLFNLVTNIQQAGIDQFRVFKIEVENI